MTQTQKNTLNIYRDDDCDQTLIKTKNIAIIGYGAQGRAHALNLRDSGVKNITIGLRDHSPSTPAATDAGFNVATPTAAVKDADIVMLLLPDEHHGDLYNKTLKDTMKHGAALAFAHGLAIHFGVVKPRADMDVFMVAPKGQGQGVRRAYVSGGGVPCLFAVHQSPNGTAKDIALSYAYAIGGGRSAIIETTFGDECETDLFGEQAVLCGGIPALIQAGYDTLIAAGYPEDIAYFECVHEAKLVVDLIYERGLAGMRRGISNTAEYGGYGAGKRLITDDTRAEMKKILSEIQSGHFVKNFMGGEKHGLKNLNNLRKTAATNTIETVGKRLRALMPWIGKV